MSDQSYSDFLKSKRMEIPNAGRPCEPDEGNPYLWEWQRRVTAWAVRKGRCALFLGTGLGKTLCQLEWARLTGERTIILCPLAVAHQTVKEALNVQMRVKYCRSQEETEGEQFVITNYDMLKAFDATAFGAVVLDESSILKAFDGKTSAALIETFKQTRWRLCATATPAPNSHTELGQTAEFLGVLSYTEMLAKFFIHEESTHWRIKKPAQAEFFRWLAGWSMSILKPSDIGFSDDGYNLPPLVVKPVFVPVNYTPEGKLFADKLGGVKERAAVRRETVPEKVAVALEIINGGQRAAVEKQNGRPGILQEVLPEPSGGEASLLQGEPQPDAGREQSLHEGILCSEQGEMAEADARGAGGAQS